MISTFIVFGLADNSSRYPYLPHSKPYQVYSGKDGVEVEQKMLKNVSKEFKVDVHHWLILHRRYICVARKPNCGNCLIEDLCEFKDKTD